jgi:hypothetical protein
VVLVESAGEHGESIVTLAPNVVGNAIIATTASTANITAEHAIRMLSWLLMVMMI